MAHIERACRARNGDVNHHVALGKQIFSYPMTLAAYDEGRVFRQLRVINASSIVGCLDSNDGFAFRHDFSQVCFLAKVPLDVVTT